MRLARRTTAAALISLFLVWLIYTSVKNTEENVEETILKADLSRRGQVTNGFRHAWRGYSKYCMGHDALHPVSNTCDDDFGGWGVSAIDALSTAIIMEQEDVVRQILEFIATIDWTVVKGGERVQLFEVAIRHFAGMISAHDLLTGPYQSMIRDDRLLELLYTQMVALGDALLCAFRTPSGVPRNWVNPKTCATDAGTSNTLAGAGSLILEFQRLSDITGNTKYGETAKKAQSYLIDPKPARMEPFPGIMGSYVSVLDGSIMDKKGSWGALADSFYEYLLKAYVYDSKTFLPYFERWKLAADSTILHIASHPYGHENWTLLHYWNGKKLHKKMDSLSWFAGGNFILGGLVSNNQTLIDFGLSIADTAGAMYSSTATKLGGEFLEWTETCKDGWPEKECTPEKSFRFTTTSFILRPEVLETWYYAYRATRDTKYREWAWDAFQGLEKYCKTDSGYAGIRDVYAADGGKKINKQESFVYAEVLKYIYLILLEDENKAPYHVQDSRTGVLNDWVFNTEAHPFRVVGPPV